MGAVPVAVLRQDAAPQESPTLSRPLFSKTRTKGVSTGANKATSGNVPALTGRRTDFVTHSQNDTPTMHQGSLKWQQSAEQMGSSVPLVLENSTPSDPSHRSTGLKSPILVWFSLYLLLPQNLSKTTVNKPKTEMEMKIHSKNSPAQFPAYSLVNTYRVDGRIWVDLQHVNVVRRILEEPIIWIQHFMAQ